MASGLVSPTGAPLRSVSDVLREQGITEGSSPRINGWLLPEEAALLQRIKLSKFFLVRNDGRSGERLRCGMPIHGKPPLHKPVYHTYLTYMCVDRPWRGLDSALVAYARVRKDDGLERKLLAGLPALDRLHPYTSHDWQPDFAGEELLGIILGTAEPISETRAELLASAINTRRPPERFIL